MFVVVLGESVSELVRMIWPTMYYRDTEGLKERLAALSSN
jgi:hypothetical protein